MPVIMDYKFKYHKRGNHAVSYGTVKREVGATSYYQYINNDDYWYMMKSVRTAAVTVDTYTVPVAIATTPLATGWTNRATTLVYKTYNEAFQ